MKKSRRIRNSVGNTELVYIKSGKKKKINWGLTFLAIPGVLVLLAIYYVPMFGLVIPFKNIDYRKGIFGSDWADPIYKNFIFFFKSNDALRVTWNTISMNLAFIAITVIVSVILALWMYEFSAKAVKIYQTCMFVPYFISWVVASYVIYALLCPDMGVFSVLCEKLGMKVPNFYNTPDYWKIILPLAYLWKNVGYMTLLYYATLLGMDMEQFEAAAIDGANKRQRIWYIMLPFLKATIIMMILLQIGKIFNADFGMFYFLSRNSATLYSVTDVIDTYVYRALRVTGDIGMSSAMGLFQSFAGFAVTLVANLIVRKIDRENALF